MTHWQALAPTASDATARIAGTASATASVSLRFGLRLSGTQPQGSYAAEVRFGVVAPDV